MCKKKINGCYFVYMPISVWHAVNAIKKEKKKYFQIYLEKSWQTDCTA